MALPYSQIIPGSGTASLTTVKVSEPEFFRISTLLLPLFIQPHAQIQTCVLRTGRIQYTGFVVWELLCFSVCVRYASSLVKTENPSLLF